AVADQSALECAGRGDGGAEDGPAEGAGGDGGGDGEWAEAALAGLGEAVHAEVGALCGVRREGEGEFPGHDGVQHLGQGEQGVGGGDTADGRGFCAGEGEKCDRREGERVAGEEPAVGGGGTEGEGGRGGEAAQGPARVGGGAVDGLVADAVGAGDAGGVELGE